ncbi:MAG: CBS domain-containing protein [Burkholderiales bacterium]|jgi:CBS domain-containing protein
MSVGEICSREVVCVNRLESVAKTAQLMRKHHVGSVVVVDEQAGARTPVGMLTDRDIVVAVVAVGLNADIVTAGDVMSGELLSVNEDAGIAETTELMRVRGVRRIPVTSALGSLVGIVAADDVQSLLAEEMSALASIGERAQRRESGFRKSAP